MDFGEIRRIVQQLIVVPLYKQLPETRDMLSDSRFAGLERVGTPAEPSPIPVGQISHFSGYLT